MGPQLQIELKPSTVRNVKWLILNHSIWSLLFEIGLTAIKPIVLTPAIAAYPIGIIRKGTFKITVIIGYFGGIVGLTFAASLTATLINRYLFTFSTVIKLLEKYLNICYILLTIAVYAVGTYAVKDILYVDPEYFYQAAIDYDPCMQMYVTNEPGFVFWPKNQLTNYGILIALTVLVGGDVCAILFGLYFIYLIKSQKSHTLEKLQHSLIISIITQLSISVSLIFIPVTFIVFVFCFEISKMENVVILFFCIIMSHSLIESIATLYFVAPYRKSAIEILSRIFSNSKIKSIQISPVTITEVTLHNRNGNRRF